MNLSTARTWVRQFARNAQDSSIYGDADIDRAIQTVGARFCRKTRALSVQTSTPLDIGDDQFTVQGLNLIDSGGVDTMPEQLMSIVFSDAGKTARVVDPDELLRIIARARSGCEIYAAVHDSSESAGTQGFVVHFYPTLTVAQNAIARFWLPFSTWTPGVDDTAAQAITLNLPESWLQQILPLGPPAQLQLHEPENVKQASAKWAEYQKLEQSFMGAGILGKKVAIRRKRCQGGE